jgi:two-component system, NarL family, sensor kinase
MDIISQEVTLVIISTAFFLLLAVGIIILILVYQKKQLQIIAQKKEIQNKLERELLNVQLETQEQTLNTVGLEIHDNVGQALSLVKLNLNRLGEETPATPLLLSTKELVSKAIQDLRTLSKTLNSNYIMDTSLSDCLKFDLAIIQQSGAIKTNLTIVGEESNLNGQSKLIVYRIAQELLNNALKHAQATELSVEIQFRTEGLCLMISDNGKGLNQKPGSAPGGTGMGNLFARAKMVGGELSIENSNPGVKACLTVPLSLPDVPVHK